MPPLRRCTEASFGFGMGTRTAAPFADAIMDGRLRWKDYFE